MKIVVQGEFHIKKKKPKCFNILIQIIKYGRVMCVGLFDFFKNPTRTNQLRKKEIKTYTVEHNIPDDEHKHTQ